MSAVLNNPITSHLFSFRNSSGYNGNYPTKLLRTSPGMFSSFLFLLFTVAEQASPNNIQQSPINKHRLTAAAPAEEHSLMRWSAVALVWRSRLHG